MKGIAAIDALIMIVIGVIAIIAILGLFMGVWTPASGGTSLTTAKNLACQKLTITGCAVHPADISIEDFDADKDGQLDPCSGQQGNNPACLGANCGPGGASTGDNLWSICVCHLGLPQTIPGCSDCMRVICGCDSDAC